MPKLKKQSNLQLQSQTSEKPDIATERYLVNSEDCSLSANLLKPQKMKLASRLKLLQDVSQQQVEKKTEKNRINSGKSPLIIKGDSQDEIFFNKLTDDDIDSNSCPPEQKHKKAKKKEIKTKNKLFSSFNFQECRDSDPTYKEQAPEELQLQVNKNQKRKSTCLLEKFDQKACIFKKKLDYKELNKDHNYKKVIQEKLKSIEQAQYVNIVIEVPKVFGGKEAHLEAAIFLKNKKQQSSTQQKIDDHGKSNEAQDQSMAPKDRRQYYEDLGKQMKLKRAETLTENALKECFKKSKLQDLDFITDLQFDQSRRQNNYQDISQISRPKNKQHFIKPNSSQDSNLPQQSFQLKQQDNRPEQNSFLSSTQNRKQQTIPKQNSVCYQKDLPSHQQINIKKNLKQKAKSKSEVRQQAIKVKPKKEKAAKKPKKQKKFQFSKYIEVEAQISSDQQQGGPRHKDEGDEQSDEDQQTQVSSLIDDDAQVDSNDRHIIHQKFMQDMIEQQQRNYNQIKQKMERRYLLQEENLRERMKQAALRNRKKQDLQNSSYVEKENQQNLESNPQSNSNGMNSSQRNQAKIKELQERLQIHKKETKENIISKPQLEKKIIKLSQIQANLFEKQNNGLKKVKRNGLQNITTKKNRKSLPKK